MEFSKEQIEKAKNCKTIEEFKSLAKNEGINITEEEVEKYFSTMHEVELSDDELDKVAGGKYTQDEANRRLAQTAKCPKCGAMGFPKLFQRGMNFEGNMMWWDVDCLNCGHSFETEHLRVKT